MSFDPIWHMETGRQPWQADAGHRTGRALNALWMAMAIASAAIFCLLSAP